MARWTCCRNGGKDGCCRNGRGMGPISRRYGVTRRRQRGGRREDASSVQAAPPAARRACLAAPAAKTLVTLLSVTLLLAWPPYIHTPGFCLTYLPSHSNAPHTAAHHPSTSPTLLFMPSCSLPCLHLPAVLDAHRVLSRRSRARIFRQIVCARAGVAQTISYLAFDIAAASVQPKMACSYLRAIICTRAHTHIIGH